MTLFEINQDIEKLIEDSVDEDGCIDESAYEALAQLQMDRDIKLRNIACLILNLTADAEAYKKQKAVFDAKKSSAEKKVARLKKLLIDNMGADEKFKCDEVAINRRKSEKAIVNEMFDITTLPQEFWKYGKPEPKLTEIKEYIKEGNKLDGCHVEVVNNVIIK